MENRSERFSSNHGHYKALEIEINKKKGHPAEYPFLNNLYEEN